MTQLIFSMAFTGTGTATNLTSAGFIERRYLQSLHVRLEIVYN